MMQEHRFKSQLRTSQPASSSKAHIQWDGERRNPLISNFEFELNMLNACKAM
jgi:hypothetical protein